MRVILKKGYPILKGDGNHGVHPVTGQPFYYGNPPPEFFHSEENPLNEHGFDRPLFSHYGELGMPQGEFGLGEFGEAVFTDEHGVEHRHGIDGVIHKVGRRLREAGLTNIDPIDFVNEAIRRYNEAHKNSEEHFLPPVDDPEKGSDEWRKLRSMDFQHSKSQAQASETKVRGAAGTLGTVYTNSGRGNQPSLGRFHESYAIPFAPFLAAMMTDAGVTPRRYDEGINVGHISVKDLSFNPATGMPVGGRKRGAQSGETIGPNGELNDTFLNRLGADAGVAVDNLHSHEMIHHMPDALYGIGKVPGSPTDTRKFADILYNLNQSKMPKELLDKVIMQDKGGPVTLRDALSNETDNHALARKLAQTPSALHLMMGDTSQGIAKKLLDDLRNEVQLPEGVSLDDMKTHIKAGSLTNKYHRDRKKGSSHKTAAELFAYAQLLGESGNFPGVSALREADWPGIRLHPDVEGQRHATELVAAALSHHYGHTPNRPLLDETPVGPNTGRNSAGFPTAPMNMKLPDHLDQYHLKFDRMADTPIAEPEQQPISPQYAKVRQTPPAQTPPSTPPITPSEEYRQAQRAFRYATPEDVRDVYVARTGYGQPGRAPAPTGPMTPQERRFQQTLSDPYQQTLDQYLRGDSSPIEDRLIKAMENLQYKDAANDDDIRKHLPSQTLSMMNEDDLSYMAEKMSITKHDVRAILFSKGDWHRVADTFNMSPTIVKAVKVAFGGGADE